MIGRKFSRLSVISFGGSKRFPSGRTRRVWECLCECGNTILVDTTSLKSGNTRSCGCLFTDSITKHGLRKTSEYQAYHDMIQRCYRDTHRSYSYYGGRGIAVCQRWRDGFENFHEDMGDKPKGTSLDRINNDGDYSPENCRWATSNEQSRNTRHNVFLTYDGKTKCIQDWSDHLGIHKDTIRYRLSRGWPVEKALSSRKFR